MHDDRAMIRGRNARKRALHRSGVSISLSRLSDRTINLIKFHIKSLNHTIFCSQSIAYNFLRIIINLPGCAAPLYVLTTKPGDPRQ